MEFNKNINLLKRVMSCIDFNGVFFSKVSGYAFYNHLVYFFLIGTYLIFLFLWVLGMGYFILLWHSLSLPYNKFSFLFPKLHILQII